MYAPVFQYLCLSKPLLEFLQSYSLKIQELKINIYIYILSAKKYRRGKSHFLCFGNRFINKTPALFPGNSTLFTFHVFLHIREF